MKLARWPLASHTCGGPRIGGVDEHDVVALLHHRPDPGVLDVAQHQRPERPVVVGAAEAAVDLRRREHEPAPLGEVDDLIELGRRHGHPGYGDPATNSGTAFAPPAARLLHRSADPLPSSDRATPRKGVIDQPEILSLFGSQYGVATSSQLFALGMSRRIDHPCRESRRADPACFPASIGSPATDWKFEARAMAAQLHCGPRSFLDGVTAGAFLGLRSMPRGRDATEHATDGSRSGSSQPWLDVCVRRHQTAPNRSCTRRALRIAHPLHVLRTLAAERSTSTASSAPPKTPGTSVS